MSTFTLQVGVLETDNLTNEGFETVNFSENFSDTPVVFTQVQTYNGTDFVRTRQKDILTGSFSVAMEEEEALQNGHFNENIGWFALESGQGIWDGNNFQAGITGTSYDENFSAIDFDASFDELPQFMAAMTTYNGTDSAGVRYQNLDSNSVEVKIEEDQSQDSETNHANESLNFLALEGEGILRDINGVAIGEFGKLENFDENSITVNLLNDYINPVVFMPTLSYNGGDPSTSRITNLDGDSFTVFLEEPEYKDGTHTTEEVSYFVFEAGTWKIGDNSSSLEYQVVEKTGTENPFDDVYYEAHTSPSLADIDEDGDLDAFIGDKDGAIHYYRNDSGTFSEQTGNSNPFNSFDFGDSSYINPTFSDIDSDGDLDGIIGKNDGTIAYLENNNGTFSEQTGNNNPLNAIDYGNSDIDPAFADIDGDGDVDAIIGTDWSVEYWQNQNGTFVEQTGSNNPFDSIASIENIYRPSPEFADIDSDGDADFILGRNHGTIHYFENNNGSFTELTGSSNPFDAIEVAGGYSKPAIGDINGDNINDLIVSSFDGTISYYEGTLV